MELAKRPRNNSYEMVLWPNRSFKLENIKFLISIVFIALLVPIIPFIGSGAETLLLMFSLITLGLFGILFTHNFFSRNLKETVRINSKEISITRLEPNGKEIFWKANSYWTKVKLYPNGQLVKNYLTLVGDNREVELGSFLSPEERTLVKEKIEHALFKVKSHI